MSILIKGIDLPTLHPTEITIFPSGKWLDVMNNHGDADEIKTLYGHWIDVTEDYLSNKSGTESWIKCSHCGAVYWTFKTALAWNFCPFCGVNMKEEVACHNCQHITEKHTDETEMCFCYCDIDRHYISYEKAEVAWCDNWKMRDDNEQGKSM